VGREEYFRLRNAGIGRQEAARKANVHVRTARDWDKGVRKSHDRRIYPDGRIVDYNKGVTTKTIKAVPAGTGRFVPLPPIPLSALEKSISPRFLSLAERETIRDMVAAGSSVRVIASALGRAASTISRELARNSEPGKGYQPYLAQRLAVIRRPRPKDRKLVAGKELRQYVKSKLLVRWSPEQISNTLLKEFPDDPHMRVSHETIYQALYLQAKGGLRREVAAALRTGRARRKAHHSGEERQPRFRDEMVMISERPPEVQDRAVPGHWEGDLIIGAYGRSAIATLVERTTRYLMLVHLPIDHTAEAVRDGLVTTMSVLPEHLRGSLTWDQGSEMARHRTFTVATDIAVYFCDPASPRQRGSNENTNGLLRQYFPKGTDLSAYGPEDLEHVAQELNQRPRKTLDWHTPAERMRDLLIVN
jgi:IS30 family transposase